MTDVTLFQEKFPVQGSANNGLLRSRLLCLLSKSGDEKSKLCLWVSLLVEMIIIQSEPQQPLNQDWYLIVRVAACLHWRCGIHRVWHASSTSDRTLCT
eukprot:1355043-Amphidinium_carterae.5